jgi:hypothetical protein
VARIKVPGHPCFTAAGSELPDGSSSNLMIL